MFLLIIALISITALIIGILAFIDSGKKTRDSYNSKKSVPL